MENYYYTRGSSNIGRSTSSEGSRRRMMTTSTSPSYPSHQSMVERANEVEHRRRYHSTTGVRTSYSTGRQSQYDYGYPMYDDDTYSSQYDQYEGGKDNYEDYYYCIQGPTDKLACVAYLADYLMYRLILMGVFPHLWSAGHAHTANAVYVFQSRVQSCIQTVESMTDRLGLMPRDSHSYAIWLEQRTELKKMVEKNKSGIPSLLPEIQHALIQFTRLLLEELQQTDKRDVTAVYHMCYLAMRLIIYASLSTIPTEADGTTFLRVVEELPQDRLTTYYKKRLETVKLLVLRAMETPTNEVNAVTCIDHFGFLLSSLGDNIKAVDNPKPGSLAKTKVTTTNRSTVKDTDVSRLSVKGLKGQYAVKPMWVTSPDGGQPRLIYALDTDNPVEETSCKTSEPSQQSHALSGAVAAAAVQSDKNSGIPSAHELGMTEDEFAAHLQQQLMLEDMHVQKEMEHNTTGNSQSTQSGLSSYCNDSNQSAYIVTVGPGDVRDVPSKPTLDRMKKKPVKEPTMPKDLETLESLTQMEEYVEEKRQDHEKKRQNLERILSEKKQLQTAITQNEIPVIKQALEAELRDKVQFLSLRQAETEIAKAKFEELDAYIKSKKRFTEPFQIEDLSVTATYELLERNLTRLQGNPVRLHLMLERQLDILDTETLAELSQQLKVKASTREGCIAEIKQRHEDALEEADDKLLY